MHKNEIPIELPNNTQKIWRYMNFSKYVDFLTTSELHFARADIFEDPFDCSSMRFFNESARKSFPNNPHAKKWAHKVNTFSRLFVYLNCWHMNDVESAALWHLYSENKHETIAIQTTFEKLDSEIKLKWPRDGISISKVKYDPENAGESINEIPGGKLFTPFGWEDIIYKRPSFVHEQELRAFIYQRVDKLREGQLRNEAHLEKLMEERPEYIRIKVTPFNLIEKVYVSPLAKDWFVELVKKVSGELKNRVKKSDLYELY